MQNMFTDVEFLNLPFRANFQRMTGLSQRYEDDQIPFDRKEGRFERSQGREEG